jgi:hypothetical protein
MGSIIKKKINGNIYYYYVESKRINGKPTLVNQKYLGTEKQFIEKALDNNKTLQDRALHSVN